jgi:hypothetical protein
MVVLVLAAGTAVAARSGVGRGRVGGPACCAGVVPRLWAARVRPW